MERQDDVCSGISMHKRKCIRGHTAHVRDCAYIWSHDMPNILFLVLTYGDIIILTTLVKLWVYVHVRLYMWETMVLSCYM